MLAAWLETDGANTTLHGADWEPGQGWSAPQPITAVNSSVRLSSVTVDDGGEAAIFWVEGIIPPTISYVHRAAGANWSATVATVPTDPEAQLQEGPVVTSSLAGGFFLAWMDTSPGGYVIHGGHVDSVGTLSSTQNLSSGALEAHGVSLVADPSGEATAVWFEYDPLPITPASYLVSSRYSLSDVWTAPSYGPVVSSYRVGVSAAARDVQSTVVIFPIIDGSENAVVARVRDAAGNWSEGRLLESPRGATDISIAPAPGGFIAWWEANGNDLFSGQPYGSATVSTFVPASGWGAQQVVANYTPSNVFVAAAARSMTDAVAVVGFAETDPAGPTMVRLMDEGGCSGWSDLGAVPSSPTPARAVAVSWLPSEPGMVLIAAVNGSAVELRSSSFDFPEQPPLTLDAPAWGSVTDRAVAFLTGTAAPGDDVEAAGVHGVADADGNFSVRVPLLEGSNEFTLHVTRAGVWAPCTPSLFAWVIYENPVPALESRISQAAQQIAEDEARIQELEAAALDVSATQEQLNTTRDDLARVQGDLDNATGELSRLSAEFAASNVNLTGILDALSAANSRADALSLRLNDTQAQLDVTSAMLNETHGTAGAAPAGDGGVALGVAAAGLGFGLLATGGMLMGRKRQVGEPTKPDAYIKRPGAAREEPPADGFTASEELMPPKR